MAKTQSRTTLLDSIDAVPGEPGVIRLSGSKPGMAKVAAVIDALKKDARSRDFAAEFLAFDEGAQVTVTRFGENMLGGTFIVADEGRLHRAGTVILPKGAKTKGFLIRQAVEQGKVLDVVPGYDTARAKAKVDAELARIPVLSDLTQEDLDALSSRSNTCSLAVFGTWPGFPSSGSCTNAVWLIHSYLKSEDIVEGVLFVDPSTGESEHGSVFGRDLLRWTVGKVDGFSGMSLQEALDALDLPQEELVLAVKELQREEVTSDAP